jgi:hypothetical protein
MQFHSGSRKRFAELPFWEGLMFKPGGLLLLNAILFVALGNGFALYGPLMINFYGVQEVEGGTAPMYWYVASFARLFGAVLLGFGLLIWSTRDQLENPLVTAQDRQRLLLALLLGNAIALIVALTQQASIWGHPAGWITAGVFLALLLGYGYLLAANASSIKE